MEYVEEVESLRDECLGQGYPLDAVKGMLPYVDAALLHLPDCGYDRKDVLNFASQVHFNQRLSLLNAQFALDLWRDGTMTIDDPNRMLDKAVNESVIFCTYHFGSYRQIHGFLARAGVRYVLPVTKDILDAQAQAYTASFEDVRNYFSTSANLEVINAEEHGAIRTLVQAVREGKSLVCYIDGNSGVRLHSGSSGNDGLVEVPYMGGTVLSRKGIAYLSHLTSTPIVPVLSSEAESRVNTIYFLTPYIRKATRVAARTT